MTYSDYLFRKVPDYYDGMYKDGFSAAEIMYANHERMLKMIKESQ